MSPAPAAPPRNYHDLFDPRVPGFSPVFPLVLYAGLFISSQMFLLFDYFVKHGSMLKDMFPWFQIELNFSAMASAFLLLWLSRQLNNSWLVGLAYGACDGLISITAVWVTGFVKSPSLSLEYWIPYATLQMLATNLLWGVLLIGLVGVAIRLAGVRILPILASGLVSWCVLWAATRLLDGQVILEWYGLAHSASSGLVYGLAMYLGLRGQLALRAAHSPPPEIAARRRLSKGFLFTSIVAGFMTGYPLVVAAYHRAPSNRALAQALAGLALAAFAAVLSLVLVHRMWSAIQDEYARTSPGRAVGMLLVPFYNIYWIFQVYRGFAVDFNAYRERHSLPAAALPSGLFLAFCILSLFNWFFPVAFPIVVATLFVEMFMIARICDAVNAIPA